MKQREQTGAEAMADAGREGRVWARAAQRRPTFWIAGLLMSGGLVACNRDTTVISAPPEARGPDRARPAQQAEVGQGAAAGAPSVTASGSGAAPATAPAGAAGGPAAATQAAATQAAATQAAPTQPANPPTATESFRHRAPGRLVAIGDLHGDVEATRAALRLAGAIDDSERWIGGNLSVVQTGDQLDRGDDEREILDLFDRLEKAAPAAGGQVIALNGNHEVMNVQGDYRYVTPGAIGDFKGVRPKAPQAGAAPPQFEDRAAAFLPGGAYARELAEREVVAVVGDSVFVHGGVAPEHVRFGIDRINHEAQTWMLGEVRGAPEALASDSSPIWMRDYSLDPVSPDACRKLGEVLTALGVRRMVVGHTVQKGGISSACEDRVYRIDVGLSRYYGQGPIQVLEIDQDRVRVLSAPREPAGAAGH